MTTTNRTRRASRTEHGNWRGPPQDSHGWQYLHLTGPLREALSPTTRRRRAQVRRAEHCRQPNTSVSLLGAVKSARLLMIHRGLVGFLLSLTPLSNDLMGWRGANAQNGAASIGCYYFFGGVLMILAAILEVSSCIDKPYFEVLTT